MAETARKHEENEQLAEGTLVSHLVELRQRLVRAVLSVLVIFVCLVPFQNWIFEAVSKPHEEDTWAGRPVRVGGAVIRIDEPVPRCVVTTLDPNTGIRDFPTLRVIRDYRGVNAENQLEFGVYAEVVEPGEVRVGDAVEPLA